MAHGVMRDANVHVSMRCTVAGSERGPPSVDSSGRQRSAPSQPAPPMAKQAHRQPTTLGGAIDSRAPVSSGGAKAARGDVDALLRRAEGGGKRRVDSARANGSSGIFM